MLRVILDTNVIFSAYFNPPGLPGKLLRRWIFKEFQLLYSQAILDEYLEIFTRHSILNQDVNSLSILVHDLAEKIIPHISVAVVKNDPDDDKFIHCAMEGKADYIVSGDSHLLGLEQHGFTKIVTVKEFLDILDTLKKEKK